MSLSKLGTTSGTSSKISFDGQDPFSEKQHPLLLPNVLDTVFPYLTFKELKNSRLVCKSWSEVAIPFIGRRKLKPVDFSNVKFEDFLALKQEFQDQSKPHPKLKFFQGFGLNWEDVVKMSYCNFMSSFKPSQLFISGRNISTDLSTNLISLLQPVLPTLTHLRLHINLDSSYSCRSFTSLLNNFAQLQPMTLKILRLEIFTYESLEWPEYHFTHEQVDAIYRAFEVVFQSQSPTLEKLELRFKCNVSTPGKYQHYKPIKRIELPIFPFLQHLILAFDIKRKHSEDYLSIFAPFDFCVKFPRLVQLDIADITLHTMKNDAIVLTRGHPLMKKLIVSKDNFDLEVDDIATVFQNLYLSFPFIEELRIDIPLLNLNLGGTGISWVDTLRVLECSGYKMDPFNFGHLKKLEYLHYTFIGDINFKPEEFQITTFIELLLEHHRQLPHLKRFHIIRADHLPTPEKMNQILKGFPEEFRAIFVFN